jgi:cytochrome c oxidase assembly protein subunit 15
MERRAAVDVLTLGLGTTVAMWGIGYFGRLPSLMIPAPVLLVLFLACVLGGGYLAGQLTGRGWLGGVWVGLLSGLVNLLVLGSLLGGDRPNQIVPSALGWVPGFILVSAVLGALGAVAGGRASRTEPEPRRWVAYLARVVVAATLLLVAVGGLVTSYGAGLAVVDWPNSYGYNMFLYPLSRMTGGVYYEHAHRLFGALVGLTTLVLAVVLQRIDDRRPVRRLAWLAVVLVVVQGILGGLRVTGRFTLSTSPEEVAPNLGLAVVHGVLAQIFLGTMVAIAAFTSPGWRTERRLVARPTAGTDRGLCLFLVLFLVVQLVLGAVQRHLSSGLMVHITMATVVAVLAAACGARAWGLNEGEPILRRLGKGLLAAILLQLVLGVGALVAVGGGTPDRADFSLLQGAVTTAHQWCGAVLLSLAVLLLVWTFRLVPAERTG